jgi:hypothetical protein
MSNKGQILTDQDESMATFVFDCPACKFPHSLQIRDDKARRPSWEWNGSLTAPTFNPSLLVTMRPDRSSVCHSFIADGKIQFLEDCTHDLAGQTVELLEHEEW